MSQIIQQGSDVWFAPTDMEIEARRKKQAWERKQRQSEFCKGREKMIEEQMRRDAILDARCRIDAATKELTAAAAALGLGYQKRREIEEMCQELADACPNIDWDENEVLVQKWDYDLIPDEIRAMGKMESLSKR